VGRGRCSGAGFRCRLHPFTDVSDDKTGERYWRLGQHDTQLNPGYYVFEHVDDFDDLEPEDDEDDEDPAEAARVAFGLEVRDRLRELDPPAFEMDTWWDRVYEEVEYDAI
jgi:hypothetical protein